MTTNKRFDFEKAIKQRIVGRPRSATSALSIQTGASPGPSPSAPRKLGFFRKVAREVALPFMRPLRRYLLNDVHEKLNQVIQSLQRQEVGAHATLNLVQGLFAQVQQNSQQVQQIAQQVQQIDAFNAVLRDTILASISARVDDLGIKARGPLILDQTSMAIRTADGFVVVPRDDRELVAMLVDASVGGLEPGTRQVIRMRLRPGATFVDIGAHVGLLSLAAARVVGNSGKVLAFEAVPKTFDFLQQTVSLNQIAHIISIKNETISFEQAPRYLNVRQVLGHSSLFSEDRDAEHERIEVTTQTLDNLIPAGTAVDLIKIDVEGAEIEVLRGMQRVLLDNPQVCLVVEFGPTHLSLSDQSVLGWFAEFSARSFRPYRIDELTGTLTPVSLEEQGALPNCNILFARD